MKSSWNLPTLWEAQAMLAQHLLNSLSNSSYPKQLTTTSQTVSCWGCVSEAVALLPDPLCLLLVWIGAGGQRLSAWLWTSCRPSRENSTVHNWGLLLATVWSTGPVSVLLVCFLHFRRCHCLCKPHTKNCLLTPSSMDHLESHVVH